jgi:hypothetical protein
MEVALTKNPEQFVSEWIDAWNEHDLDRILSHYTDDFEMTSPYIVQLMGDSSGTLHSKEQIRAYWKRGLEVLPDLHFKPIDFFTGVNCIALHYEGAQGRRVVEVFHFAPDGRVCRANSLYS